MSVSWRVESREGWRSIRWRNSSSNALYGLGTWRSSTTTIYVNGRAFRPVGDVQHSPSIWYFYVLKLIFWLPKQHLSWPRDSILQCDAIWILNLLPGLASKGVGRLRSCLSVLFLDENRLLAELYMHRRLDIGVFLSLDNDDKTDTIHFAGIIYCPIPPDSRKFLQNHNMSPSPKTTTSVH